MSQLLVSIASFVLVVGVLITAHEFGHFWVARRLGVKVLRFSIGFGKPLIKWQGRDQTEYVVAAIPLGGYVKMLDEREGEVDPQDLPQAFNRKSLPVRSAIVAAGPVFNFIFAIFAYWLMFMHGVSGVRPVIGDVAPQTISSAAGFISGDEIRTIDGSSINSWEEALFTLLEATVKGEAVNVEVIRPEVGLLERRLDLSRAPDALKKSDLLKNLGLSVWRPEIPPLIASLEQNGPADRAGFLAGDRILSANDLSFEGWSEWTKYVRERPESLIRVVVERGGESVELALKLGRKGARCAEGYGYMGASAKVPEGYGSNLRIETAYSPLDSASRALTRTWDVSLLTVKMIGKMLLGEVSLNNLSGPVTIAKYAGESSRIGLSALLGFMALVSVSLGVLNLLPIPVLDGGHLLYYLVESVKGSPLSEEAQLAGQRYGIAALLLLMMLALYNDLVRLIC